MHQSEHQHLAVEEDAASPAAGPGAAGRVPPRRPIRALRVAYPYVPRKDARTALRLRRMQVGCAFAALYLVGLAVFHWQGLIDATTFFAACLLVTGVTLLFSALFLRNMRRPGQRANLAAPIGAAGIAIMLWLVAAAPATRIIFAPFVFAIIASCMYRLRQRTVLLLCLATLAGYAGVIGLHWFGAADVALLRQDLLHWFVLVLTLPSFVLLTGRVQRLHGKLQQAGLRIRDIEEHARRDPLTNCYNRRYMVAALEEQKRAADADQLPLCLAVIDLDHFKRVNDEVGHLAGDEVLRRFAEVAAASIRETDVIGRYGGEEFLLILPATGLSEALEVAERLRARVECHGWPAELQGRVTVSVGLTQYIAGESVLDLFSRTDTAMYLAKRGGRNQVVVEEPAAGLWPHAC